MVILKKYICQISKLKANEKTNEVSNRLIWWIWSSRREKWFFWNL